MSKLDIKSKAIIDAAQKAVANIQNPTQRAEAEARLDATLKKLESAMARSSAGSRSSPARDRVSDRDQELDR